jgi:hypothetical protein
MGDYRSREEKQQDRELILRSEQVWWELQEADIRKERAERLEEWARGRALKEARYLAGVAARARVTYDQENVRKGLLIHYREEAGLPDDPALERAEMVTCSTCGDEVPRSIPSCWSCGQPVN